MPEVMIMTIQDAAQRLGKSEATIRRWIKQGKLESTLIDGKYNIEEAALNEYAKSEAYIGNGYAQEVLIELEYLRKQNEDLHKQISDQKARIEKLELQLDDARSRADEASHRHDTVVMQMTRLLEYHQQPFWKRLLGRKALPPPVDETIMDMEPGDDKSKE